MSTPTDTIKDKATTAPQNKERFTEHKDERLKVGEGYGGGVKDKTNPAPSTVPSSPQTDKAKPIGKGKATRETDRT